jgi:hypothetical protein
MLLMTIALAGFENEKESPLDQSVVQRKTTIHTRKSQRQTWLSDPNDSPPLRQPSISTDAGDCYPYNRWRNTNIRAAVTHSQRLFITLRYLATGNSFEDMKFIRVTSRLELLCWRRVTAQQTDVHGMDIAHYCTHCSIYCVKLHFINTVYCATL